MLKLMIVLMILSSSMAHAACSLSEVKIFSQDPDLSEKTWMKADGRSLSVANNYALYNLIQNIYGGDTLHFSIPDIRPVKIDDNEYYYYICVGGNFQIPSTVMVSAISQYASPIGINIDHDSYRIHPTDRISIIPMNNNWDYYRVVGTSFVERISNNLILPMVTLGEEISNGGKLTNFMAFSGGVPFPDGQYPCLKGEIVFHFFNVPQNNLKAIKLPFNVEVDMGGDSEVLPGAFECI